MIVKIYLFKLLIYWFFGLIQLFHFRESAEPENLAFHATASSGLISLKIGSGVPIVCPPGIILLSTVGSQLSSARRVS